MKRRAWFMVGLGALLALVYAQLPRPQAETFLQNPNGQALLEVYQRIQQDYLEPLSKEKLDKLLEGAIGGMVQAPRGPLHQLLPAPALHPAPRGPKGRVLRHRGHPLGREPRRHGSAD